MRIALLASTITEIEHEATAIYQQVLGDRSSEMTEDVFAAVDQEYADMAADLRSAKEANRCLLAHLTAALVRAPLVMQYTTEDAPDES